MISKTIFFPDWSIAPVAASLREAMSTDVVQSSRVAHGVTATAKPL
jgi:hypothetical protein